jgi:hypothetical protein
LGTAAAAAARQWAGNKKPLAPMAIEGSAQVRTWFSGLRADQVRE